MEGPISGDWKTGDFVVRIGCLCDESYEEEDGWKYRTEFLPFNEAVECWNEMNEHRVGSCQTLFRSKKNGQLYLLGENRMHYYGKITGEPYNRFENEKDIDLLYDKTNGMKKELKLKDFEKVAIL